MNPRYLSLPALLLGVFVLALTAPAALAQSEETAAPPANPEDVSSVDSIIAAIYDVISGPANHPRDWDRFRSLLTPTCQFIPIQRNQTTGDHQHVALTAEQFVQNAGAYFDQNSFYEIEVARKSERYGNLVHAFSTYESYNTKEDEKPFQRGINSFQLLYEQDRWWVANIAWQPEWPNLPIPEGYLPNG